MGYKLQITAELKQWQLDDERCNVTGTIHNTSEPSEYKENDRFSILNFVEKTHYPAFKTDTFQTEEHWLIKTHTGKYFVLYRSQMK